jgi:hypothetical protein
LFVRVGTRTFGILMTIPGGSTAAAFKPNFVMVANAIVPKLRTCKSPVSRRVGVGEGTLERERPKRFRSGNRHPSQCRLAADC